MTMRTTHTPGPWHVGIKQAEKIVYNAKGWAIANATVYHGESDKEEVQANARLIAAAPDLLAALQGALVMLERLAPDVDRKLIGGSECSIGHYASYHVETARAAIARATGEQS